jgi:hypothetical protein
MKEKEKNIYGIHQYTLTRRRTRSKDAALPFDVETSVVEISHHIIATVV